MPNQTELEILLKAQDQTRAAFESVQKTNQQLAQQVEKLNAGVSAAGENAIATGVKFGAGFELATKAIEGVINTAIKCAEAVAKIAAEGERISNKSLITGFANDSVQSLARLAKNSQVSSESVFAAIGKMQRAAVDGKKGFTDLGFGLEEFLRLAPEAQLEAVADKIMSLPTAAERAAAAMDLFGRSGQELLPVLAQVAERGGADIVTMSESQIRSLKAVDEAINSLSGAWTDFANQVMVAAATAGGTSFLQGMANELRGMAQILKEGGILRWLELMIQAGSGPAGAVAAAQAEMAANARAMADAAIRSSGGGAEWSSFKLAPMPWQQEETGPFRMQGFLTEAQARGLEMQQKIDEQRAASARKLADELDRLEQRHTEAVMRGAEAELRSLDNLDKADAAFTSNRMANEERLIAAEQAAVDAQLSAEARLSAQMAAEEARRLADAERAAEERRAAMARVLDEIGILFAEFGVNAESALGKAISGFQDLGNAALGAESMLANLASGNIWGAIAAGIGVVSAAVSGLKSIWNSIFGQSEIEKTNDARDAFFAQWEDGYIGVQRALLDTMGAVGEEDWVKELFDAKSMEELDAIIAKIRAAIEGLGKDVPPVTIPVEYESPGAPPGGGGGESAPEARRGAIVLPFVPRAQQGMIVAARPGGSLVRMGEGGQAELVGPVAALAREIGAGAMAAATNGAIRLDLRVYMDGHEVMAVVDQRVKAGLSTAIRRG